MTPERKSRLDNAVPFVETTKQQTANHVLTVQNCRLLLKVRSLNIERAGKVNESYYSILKFLIFLFLDF